VGTEYKENAFEDLYRIIDIVARARYNAQRRLLVHASLVQFTLTFNSIALIIIPLLDLAGYNRNYSAKYVQIMQIIFAVMLLAYSLLLSMGRFESRAERMHGNGLVLSRMLRALKPFIGKNPQEKRRVYDAFYSRYYDTLEKAENSRQIDHHSAVLAEMVREGIPKRKGADTRTYLASVCTYLFRLNRLRLRVYFMWALIFSHYILSVLAMYAWIFVMVYPHRSVP
jgi:hypothetical protein